MNDPNTKDPILRSLSLLMLREELPADAFDLDAHAITLAANDPARGEP